MTTKTCIIAITLLLAVAGSAAAIPNDTRFDDPTFFDEAFNLELTTFSVSTTAQAFEVLESSTRLPQPVTFRVSSTLFAGNTFPVETVAETLFVSAVPFFRQ